MSLLLSIAVLSSCTNNLYANIYSGAQKHFQLAPGDNNTGSIGDGDNNNTGGDNNNTDGGGDGDNNNTNGGGGDGDNNNTEPEPEPEPDNDPDKDGILNDEDVDDDGDGLIEISTATEFNYMRLDLTGRSVGGSTLGCGGGLPQSATSCNGFELTNDIDLGAFSSWPPIGSCSTKEECPVNIAFRTEFEGNNHVIRNLNLVPQNTVHGLGLFGSVIDANIRNVIIERVYINPIAPSNDIGVIAVAYFTRIENVHVRDLQIDTTSTSDTNVGGLVARTKISDVVNCSVSGYISVQSNTNLVSNNVGGMIGDSFSVALKGSAVRLTSLIAKANHVGGLVGSAWSPVIAASSSHIGVVGVPNYNIREILEDVYIGGIIGYSEGFTDIYGTYSHVNRFELAYSSNSFIGGLIGKPLAEPFIVRDDLYSLDNSYAITNSFTAAQGGNIQNQAGGIIGLPDSHYGSIASYWDDRVQFLGIGSAGAERAIGRRNAVELRSPTNFTSGGIYENWAHIWCHPETFNLIKLDTSPSNDYIKLWDLGTANEYPALRCSPFSLVEQRTATNSILTGGSPIP